MQQLMDEIATAVGQTVRAECAAWRTMRPYFWRAQAEMLKGMLAVVESRIDAGESEAPPAGERIPVD